MRIVTKFLITLLFGLSSVVVFAQSDICESLNAARKELNDLKLRYTDAHPAVIALKQRITGLEAQAATRNPGDPSCRAKVKEE
jgi:uncharacterized protein involved in exopolysaccharide biosynthesis